MTTEPPWRVERAPHSTCVQHTDRPWLRFRLRSHFDARQLATTLNEAERVAEIVIAARQWQHARESGSHVAAAECHLLRALAQLEVK